MKTADRNAPALLLCMLALAPMAAGSTFVIDDDGGPGVDFTDLPPAVAAAMSGDVLLVRAGTYHGVALTKGLAILGESQASVFIVGQSNQPSLSVEQLPANEVAILADFGHSAFWASGKDIKIRECVGTVIVQRVASSFEVIGSRDVRMQGVTSVASYNYGDWPPAFPGYTALSTWRSRVEVVQSTLQGANGYWYDVGDYGSPGVYAAGPGNALVHLALTDAVGGYGGFGQVGGHGGAGVLVGWDPPQGLDDAGCTVVIAGSNLATVRGGDAGASEPGIVFPVPGGSALFVRDPSVRYSGVELIGGASTTQPGQQVEADDPSHVSSPAFADPTLAMSGVATAGGSVLLTLRGQPRSKGFLYFGKKPIVRADAQTFIEVLVDVERARKLGVMPASGRIDQLLPIPSTASVGSVIYVQGAVTLPDGEYRRTNSIPIVVR